MFSTSQGALMALPAVCGGGWAKEKKDPVGQRHLPVKVDDSAGCSLALLTCRDKGRGPRLDPSSLALKKLNLYTPQEKLRHEGHCSIYLHQHGTDWHV